MTKQSYFIIFHFFKICSERLRFVAERQGDKKNSSEKSLLQVHKNKSRFGIYPGKSCLSASLNTRPMGILFIPIQSAADSIRLIFETFTA